VGTRGVCLKQATGRFTIALLAVLLVSSCGNSFSGKCVSVSDGDTIHVLRSGKAIRIRLYGVDCPEMGQDFGKKARQFTSAMVFGKVVDVKPVDTDQYGRTVAWVSADGKSLNRELVAAGLAWWYRHYAPGDKDLADLEHAARKQKIGLWSIANPLPPWEFRHRK
jgi:micrococcal nuclease